MMPANFIPAFKPETKAIVTFEVKDPTSFTPKTVSHDVGVVFKVLTKSELEHAAKLDVDVVQAQVEWQMLLEPKTNAKEVKQEAAQEEAQDDGVDAEALQQKIEAASKAFQDAVEARLAYVTENLIGFAQKVADDFEAIELSDEDKAGLFSVQAFKNALVRTFYQEQRVALRKN